MKVLNVVRSCIGNKVCLHIIVFEIVNDCAVFEVMAVEEIELSDGTLGSIFT